MGACPVDASLADGGQTSPASIEPPTTQTAATENSEAPVTQALATETQAVEEPAAPTIHSVDAIIAEVTQSVTVAAPGQDIASNEDLTYTGSITDPAATESDSTIDAASLDDLE